MDTGKINVGKIACGIILYNPDLSVQQKIISYSKLFDYLFVYDNSEKSHEEWTKNIANVRYLSKGSNIGLSAAYNVIIKELPSDVIYLCCLDQDSIFNDEDISVMFHALYRIPDDCAVLGPHIIYDRKEFQKKDAFLPRRYVITSGCFISIPLLKKLNISFDENYFIDKFEVDLDMQFRRQGKKIYEYEGACLYQQLGETGKNGKRNHSPLRHYYLFRNRFYFNKKWFENPMKRYFLNVSQTSRQLLQILCNEENKAEKIRMLPVAFNDYRNSFFGKH